MLRRRDQRLEDPGPAHDARLLGMRERHADDVDPEARGCRILLRQRRRAPRELFGGTDRRLTGDKDVDDARVFGIGDHGVRMRSAARLHVGHDAGVRGIADVDDAYAAEALRADGLLHALRAAIDAAILRFPGEEQQILVHGDVVLLLRAALRVDQAWVERIRDIPHREA